MSKYKCLIVDDMHSSICDMLREIDVEPNYSPKINREEIIASIEDYDMMIIRSKTKVDAELLQNAKKLKVVGRAGAGIDNLDEDYLRNSNIKIINAPEGNRDAVAEHTMGLLLSLLNNINKSDKEVRKKIWDREGNRGVELSGKTVGIIGYGNMGKELLKRLKAFRCKVLIYDKYLKDFEYGHQQKATLKQIQEKCDIITLHVPLTEETIGWLDHDFFNGFSKSIFLVNTARGEVVKNDAVVSSLKSGKLLGASLDVLENEKLNSLNEDELNNFNYLTSSDKVVLTPHIAGWSKESYFKINKVLVDKMEDILKYIN